MAPTTALYINGRDLAEFGLAVTEPRGLWDGFSLNDQVTALPGASGAVLTNVDAIVPPREFSVGAVIRAASVAARISAEDNLNFLLRYGDLELRRVDLAGRARFGRCQSVLIAPTAPEFIATSSKLELKVLCLDPLAYDLTPTPVSFGATLVPMPLGTAPVAPRIFLFGAATNPVITYADASGGTIATMTLTGTLNAGETLDIDCLRQTIARVDTSGVRTNARSWLTGGTYLVLNPSYGDQPNGVYPQLKVSAGSALATYFRSWF